jgi:hypothetical protein
MARTIKSLRIDEVSAVHRAANPGATVVMRKSDSAVEKRRSRLAPTGEGPMHNRYALEFERVRRGTPKYPGDHLHAQVWNSFSEAEQIALLAEEGATEQQRDLDKERQMKKIDSAEMFEAWWKELSPTERARYRRQQADIDARLAEQERLSRAGTTTRAEVAPTTPSPQPKRARGEDALRQIVKSYGVMPLAKMISQENDAHGISEAEFMVFAGEYAATKNQTVGALLSAANGEGALLGKALAICRYSSYARQAESNLLAARLRQRG